jgi:hypothetical protein
VLSQYLPLPGSRVGLAPAPGTILFTDWPLKSRSASSSRRWSRSRKLTANGAPLSLEAITYELLLHADAEVAFAAYTARIAEWWDPRYTANAGTLESVTIEPRAGGRVYVTHSDIGEHD